MGRIALEKSTTQQFGDMIELRTRAVGHYQLPRPPFVSVLGGSGPASSTTEKTGCKFEFVLPP